MKSKTGFRGFIYFLSFIAIILVALSLTIAGIFPKISGALNLVAEIVAYTITGSLAFNYAKYKSYWLFYVFWIIAIVLIVVFKFIR